MAMRIGPIEHAARVAPVGAQLLKRILTEVTLYVLYRIGSVGLPRVYMATPERAEISNALLPLREVTDSLRQAASGDIPAGAERRRLVRRVRTAGNAAVPALIRALASPL